MGRIIASGITCGIMFCVISAMSDVYIAKVTQALDSSVFITWCFAMATMVFLTLALMRNGRAYLTKVNKNKKNLLLINVAVLLNWGGLIISLKYLEPAVVGIASVACGPALTIILSRFLSGFTTRPDKAESVISWAVMIGVMIMLINSWVGSSGVTSTSATERAIGIICVLLSAVGTVLYTLFSKSLVNKKWSASEILGCRNVLILFTALLYSAVMHISLQLDVIYFLIVVLLSVVGHIIPIFLIQKSIGALSPLHIAFLMLLIPVFTLAFQFTDRRIAVSWQTIIAVLVLTALLALLGISKYFSATQSGGEK